MEPPAAPPPRAAPSGVSVPYRWLVVPSLIGIAVAGFFLVRSVDDDLVYYLYTSEAVARRADFPDGTRFRLAGVVVPSSVAEEADGTIRFVVSDGLAEVRVVLTRTPPPLFDEDVEVLLDGAWRGDEFVADQALILHDENYQAPTTGGPG